VTQTELVGTGGFTRQRGVTLLHAMGEWHKLHTEWIKTGGKIGGKICVRGGGRPADGCERVFTSRVLGKGLKFSGEGS